MVYSSPPNSNDPHGGSVSGLTVIVGLVLLVLAGTAFAVATYLAMGPASLRQQAIAKAIAEGQTPQAASDDSDVPATPGEQMPLPAGAAPAASPAAAQSSPDSAEAPSAATGDGPRTDQPANGEPPPVPSPGTSGIRLTELSPLEMVGTGANAGDWRGPIRIGGQTYDHAVSLQPAEDQGVAQIAFALKARFARFRGFATIVGDDTRDAPAAKQNSPQAVFRVYGDGNLLWDSGPLSGPGERQPFECDVSGVDVLTLVAESQSSASISNFAWGDPTLLTVEKAAPGN